MPDTYVCEECKKVYEEKIEAMTCKYYDRAHRTCDEIVNQTKSRLEQLAEGDGHE